MSMEEKPSVESICLRLSKTVDLVRAGDFDHAQTALDYARRGGLLVADVRVAVWIMIVEGLILYYRDLEPSAADRLRRALALSEASRLPDMVARSAVWLAHMQFEDGRYVDAIDSLRRVIGASDDLPDDARLRLYIVLASCLICARMPNAADPYYSAARSLANRLQDRSSIGAIIFNRAALRMNLLRISCAVGETSLFDAQNVSRELSSSVNFDNLTGAKALVSISRVLRARLFLLAGKSRLARTLLVSQSRAMGEAPHLGRRSALHLDLAWCDIDQGQYASAMKLLQELSTAQVDKFDIDDRIVYFYLLRRAAEGIGDATAAEEASSQLSIVHETYSQQVSFLQDALSGISVPL